ncbi:MAG TPA: thioredoxin domain-containing protein [Terriglobales bacterium]
MSTSATNSLASASSAYLRSAMHQPIQWHEWNDEAFRKAQQQNKPVLLDIGAVWCHWCHVMDRESYDNPEVAAIINDKFIAVKVDRDERPDVDGRYQAAVSAISGQGGWPLTAFLTPDGRPFFGGTYFPPDDHLGRPGFKRVLLSIAQAYQTQHGDVLESAESVMAAISQAESFAGRSGEIRAGSNDRMIESAVKMFDPQNGGFGSAPKFPHPSIMDLLLDHLSRTGDEQVKRVVTTTLDRMALGGVYDHLAGGFHRYSVDERWVVPHFEKMSYDNSELLKNYVHGYQVTGNDFYADVARDIIRWMDEWLSDRKHGGFYASQDADYSMDDDGDYFTWTLAEARAVLEGDDLAVATYRYDIGEIGEMHHNPQKNVLHVRATLEQIGTRIKKDPAEVEQLLDSAKKKLLAARLKRPTPYVDKTVYVNWNSLCISAYLEAARVLDEPEAKRFALRSLDRILSQGWINEEGLAHLVAYSDPNATFRRLPGMLDDYAFTAIACLDAYESTSDLNYFRFAERITDQMIERFFDTADGGFFDSALSKLKGTALGALSAPRKPVQDSPTPAGNPAAAIALLRMHSYTNHKRYYDHAERTLQAFAGIIDHFGIFAGTYGLALAWYSRPHTQIVVIGSDATAGELCKTAVEPYAVGKSVLCLGEGHAVAPNLPPALAETVPSVPGANEGKGIAIVCSGFSCQPPLSDPAALERRMHDLLSAAVHSH